MDGCQLIEVKSRSEENGRVKQWRRLHYNASGFCHHSNAAPRRRSIQIPTTMVHRLFAQKRDGVLRQLHRPHGVGLRRGGNHRHGAEGAAPGFRNMLQRPHAHGDRVPHFSGEGLRPLAGGEAERRRHHRQ